ncbi:FbpB family small basic protein [Priestia megaterium]|uniref:FbpB family small basic protein n=1 Tax=Priestia megaterium TaxID=1404 RepID=UPI00159C4799
MIILVYGLNYTVRKKCHYEKVTPPIQSLVNENRHKILGDKKVMEKIEARQGQAIKMKTK